MLFSANVLTFILGQSTPIKHLSLRSLLPPIEQFMTYEGSTTHPGCWETTVWIILNKPIYITKQEVWFIGRVARFVFVPKGLAINFRNSIEYRSSSRHKCVAYKWYCILEQENSCRLLPHTCCSNKYLLISSDTFSVQCCKYLQQNETT